MVEPINSLEGFGIQQVLQSPPKHTASGHRKCSYTQGIQMDPKTHGVLQFMMCEHQEYAYGGFYSQDYVDHLKELTDFVPKAIQILRRVRTIGAVNQVIEALEFHLDRIEEGVSE